MLLQLSWKNIWRNKTRSLVILSAIAIGLFGGLFSAALMNGMIEQRIKTAIANETANFQIHNPKFLLNKEIKDTIAGVKSISASLDTLGRLKCWSARLKVTAMASSAITGTGVIINGIDPVREAQVSNIHNCIVDSSGSWFAGSKPNTVVIGRKLADKLKVKLRSKLIVTFQSASDDITTAAFRVSGIYETENAIFDERNIYVKQSDLLPLIGFQEGAIHEIAVSLSDDTQTFGVCAALQKKFSAVEVRSWKEIQPDLGMMSDSTKQMLMILLIIILLALSFGIINTMMMAVMERTHEIGMLLSVGMSRRRIFFMVLLETVMLALTGALAGMAISFLTIHLYSANGIDLSVFSDGLRAIGYSTVIYPVLDLKFYFQLSVIVFITGVLSALFPARRALKLNPVEAIRQI